MASKKITDRWGYEFSLENAWRRAEELEAMAHEFRCDYRGVAMAIEMREEARRLRRLVEEVS